MTLVKNRNFRIIFFIFAIMNGSVICLGAIINFLLEGFHFNNVQISVMSATFVFVGLLSSMVFPILIEKFHWFSRSLKIIACGACLSMVLVIPAVESGNFIASTAAIGTLGGFLIPTLCVIYSFAIELTYPVSVALFGCLLQAGASIYGTLMTYLCTYIIRKFGSLYVVILLIIFFAICSLLSVFVKEDLRRLNLAKKRRNERYDKKRNI